MRIAVFTPTFLPTVGGAELGIHEIYSRIGTRHDVTIVAPGVAPKVAALYGADEYGAASYRVLRIGGAGRSKSGYLARQLAARTSGPYIRACSTMTARSPLDVANIHFLKPFGFLAAYLRRRTGVPVAVSMVGRRDVLALLGPVARAHAHSVLMNAQVAIPNSSFYVADSHLPVPAHVVPYGVDTEAFVPKRGRDRTRQRLRVAPDEFVLLSVQRLAPVKRVDVLLQVAALLRRLETPVRLVLVGKGEERAALEALANRLGIAPDVSFWGYASENDLPGLFAAADAYVSHSMFETFGIVFAQAMACGLPIVAAASSCVPHVLSNANAVLVRPFVVEEFAQAVQRLMTEPELAATMGETNRTRAVADLDWRNIAERYEDILMQAAAARPAAGSRTVG